MQATMLVVANPFNHSDHRRARKAVTATLTLELSKHGVALSPMDISTTFIYVDRMQEDQDMVFLISISGQDTPAEVDMPMGIAISCAEAAMGIEREIDWGPLKVMCFMTMGRTSRKVDPERLIEVLRLGEDG